MHVVSETNSSSPPPNPQVSPFSCSIWTTFHATSDNPPPPVLPFQSAQQCMLLVWPPTPGIAPTGNETRSSSTGSSVILWGLNETRSPSTGSSVISWGLNETQRPSTGNSVILWGLNETRSPSTGSSVISWGLKDTEPQHWQQCYIMGFKRHRAPALAAVLYHGFVFCFFV